MSPTTSLRVALLMAVLAWSASAEVIRTPVPDPRPLMIAALQAADGAAHGVLTGDVADAISKRFGATSPVFIDVETERRFRQSGCSRLKVTLWQEGVTLPGATKPRRQSVEFGINYCIDGRPPSNER